MLKLDVLNRFSGKVQFTAEIDCAEDAAVSVKLGLAVRWAFKSGAYLSGAYLSGADLRGADLRGAYLSGADLSGADLRGADLRGADLRDAYLRGADLSGANLSRADLRGADLRGADLSRANLSRADLRGADLSGAYLRGAAVIDGGQRSDGYRFVGWIKDGVLQIRAGCRDLTITEAREHWARTRGGTPLGAETMAILDHIEAIARIRGLAVPAQAEEAA
jgi:hypothetical protein